MNRLKSAIEAQKASLSSTTIGFESLNQTAKTFAKNLEAVLAEIEDEAKGFGIKQITTIYRSKPVSKPPEGVLQLGPGRPTRTPPIPEGEYTLTVPLEYYLQLTFKIKICVEDAQPARPPKRIIHATVTTKTNKENASRTLLDLMPVEYDPTSDIAAAVCAEISLKKIGDGSHTKMFGASPPK